MFGSFSFLSNSKTQKTIILAMIRKFGISRKGPQIKNIDDKKSKLYSAYLACLYGKPQGLYFKSSFSFLPEGHKL
jgi:hypothetical protein